MLSRLFCNLHCKRTRLYIARRGSTEIRTVIRVPYYVQPRASYASKDANTEHSANAAYHGEIGSNKHEQSFAAKSLACTSVDALSHDWGGI